MFKIKAILSNTRRKLTKEKEESEKEKRLFEDRKNKLDQDIDMYTSTDLNDIDNILNSTIGIKEKKNKGMVINKVYNFSWENITFLT